MVCHTKVTSTLRAERNWSSFPIPKERSRSLPVIRWIGENHWILLTKVRPRYHPDQREFICPFWSKQSANRHRYSAETSQRLGVIYLPYLLQVIIPTIRHIQAEYAFFTGIYIVPSANWILRFLGNFFQDIKGRLDETSSALLIQYLPCSEPLALS